VDSIPTRIREDGDQPVSLYGGMVNLPLIVTRPDEVSWFLDLVKDGHLWAERESELKGETERMALELRDNLLRPEVWGALEPATRGRGWGLPCNKTSASASRCRHVEPSPGGLHVGAQPRYQRVLLEADLHGLL